MSHLTFFYARDPKKETPKLYTQFRLIYPVEDPFYTPSRTILVPVVGCVSWRQSSKVGGRSQGYGIFFEDNTYHEFVFPGGILYDLLLCHMTLEEELLRLIAAGRISSNAWFRLY